METTISLPSSLLSNPLFSTLVTLSLLILLYFPYPLLRISLSPILISTSILLFLLRLGASQQPKPKHGSPHRVETRIPTQPNPLAQRGPVILDHGTSQREAGAEAPCNWVDTRSSNEPQPGPERGSFENVVDPHCCYGVQTQAEFEPEAKQEGWPEPGPAMGPNLYCGKTFVGWEVGAPLEVIYEVYEGEEDGEEDENVAFQNNICTDKIKRYPSLSRYYPESDSDSDSDSECSSSSWEGELWDGDQDREELIEIALDNYGDHKGIKKKIVDQEVQVDDEEEEEEEEEDNLIEIDISPTRSSSGFCW